jgi:hypothetical protein
MVLFLIPYVTFTTGTRIVSSPIVYRIFFSESVTMHTMGFPAVAVTLFSKHVTHVVGLGTYEQMSRIAAGGIVAMMTYEKTRFQIETQENMRGKPVN